MSEVQKFYEVAVCLEATWKDNIFTYESAEDIADGTIVEVPFGRATKLGYIRRKTTRPDIPTKQLRTLSYVGRLSAQTLRFIDWMNTQYPAMSGLHTQFMLPKLVSAISPQHHTETPLPTYTSPDTPLTEFQERAVKELVANTKPAVLHGITGSGKTRVYQELAYKTLQAGKNVLILYPEIALTPHIQTAFVSIVPAEQLHIYHSKNTPKQQRETWMAALNGNTKQIFIGPRSALFLPLSNLGLIVLDEAHDASYKQDSGSRYNGLLVAGALAKIHHAKLVLGSATPPATETQFVLSRGGSLVCMHELAISSEYERSYRVIDMTDRNTRGSSIVLSKPLIQAIGTSLEQQKQSLLFLNRRGTARSLLCTNCGWHSDCPRCNHVMAYHHDTHVLQCHVCGLRLPTPPACPDCSNELKQQSPGVKAIEQELRTLFPDARISRFDSDNKKAESMAEQYKAIRGGSTDIILGTQIVTKGLDLPKLETVGILQADNSLLLPDYSSRERSFQQLTQVSGRVGRGHVHGTVYLQTYNPKNELFKLVQTQDWHTFFQTELDERKQAGFPPFQFMLRIWIHKKSDSSAEKAARMLAQMLVTQDGCTVLGPAPTYYAKVIGKKSWQLLVLSKSRTTLANIIKHLSADTYYDLDPITTL